MHACSRTANRSQFLTVSVRLVKYPSMAAALEMSTLVQLAGTKSRLFKLTALSLALDSKALCCM